MTDAFVLGGVRSPVGRYGGALAHLRTDDLLGQRMVWACERVGVDLDRIEDIAAGCVIVAHAAPAAGFPESADEKLGPNGGAVAIGHPFGSSAARYVLTLATELRERNARYGVAGVCVGSGQGVAIVLENPQAA